MGKKSSILGGAILLTATNLFLRLISIGFNVFLSDQIGSSGLGLLQLISTVSLFSMLIGTSGVRVSAMYLSAEEFGHRRLGGVRLAMSACIRYGLIISTIVGVAQVLLADFFAVSWLNDVRAALSLRVMGLLLPFTCLSGIMTGYFTACGRIRQLVVIEIAERIVCLMITVALLLTWAKGDLEKSCCAIILGSSLGAVLDFVLLYARYRRDMRHVKPLHEMANMRKRLIKLCVPLALNDYLRSGLNTAEQLLIPYGLARYGGSTEQAMSDYGTIHAMVFPVLMFPAAVLYSVADLLVPELSRCRAMGRNLRIIDLTDKCLRLCTLFSTAVAGVLFLNADRLGQMIYKSADAGMYLQVFAPMIFMLYLDAIVDGMLKGLAEQISCVRYNTFTSVLDVAFLILLLPRYGIGGYIFSFLVTHAINLYLSLQRLLKVSKHQLRILDLVNPLICVLPTIVISMLLPTQNIYLKGGFFLSMLFALFVLTDTLRQKDRTWIWRVVKKIDTSRSCR